MLTQATMAQTTSAIEMSLQAGLGIPDMEWRQGVPLFCAFHTQFGVEAECATLLWAF
jgi:hypothetical protein